MTKGALSAKKKDAVKCTFRQDSLDFKFLLKLFKTGQISPTMAPASVRNLYIARFGKYTTNQFRSQFNKAKGIAGSNGKIPTLGFDVLTFLFYYL